MSYLKPAFRHPRTPKNNIGNTLKDYEAAMSTLCAGCGHDSIGMAIQLACFELDISPHRIAKMSGIGCSSKTPAYFLGKSHKFNAVHGRMPCVTTGANLANKDLVYIGVSGDGDTASIGMGQFAHVIRRNLDMVYIVMNNGCYGLTKGQDSATADLGSISKAGSVNPFEGIDLASLAVELGASFVAQSFSGDKEQLIPLIKAAIKHKGFAFINVVSPCVTFNNNAGSTKSYDYVRDHQEATSTMDFVLEQEEITASYREGDSTRVTLHDGSVLQLNKLAREWDPYDRFSAKQLLYAAKARNEILTGLVYLERKPELHQTLKTATAPLIDFSEASLCPGAGALAAINAGFR